MAAEKRFENKVKEYLEKQGIYPFAIEKHKIIARPIGYYEKRWGGGKYTKKGLPDMHIIVHGISLEVELKAEDGRPSNLQLRNLKQIDDSGAYAILLYPNQWELFKNFLDCIIEYDQTNAALNYDLLKRRWSG